MAINALNDARFNLEDVLQYLPKSERVAIETTIGSIEELFSMLKCRGLKLA